MRLVEHTLTRSSNMANWNHPFGCVDDFGENISRLIMENYQIGIKEIDYVK